MVQLVRPSRNNHVRDGLDIDAVFSLYGNCLDQDGGDSRDHGRDLRFSRLYVTGLPRQNVLYGSGVGARAGHTQ